MVITVKGGRGRPLSIDPDKLLAEMYRTIPVAQQRLNQLRSISSGERREEIFGSETTLPKSVDAALDVLDALKTGQQITHKTALELRRTTTMLRQLASPQSRVYGRALDASLQSAYEEDIAFLTKRSITSPLATQYLTDLQDLVNSMTPKQRQSFLLSKGYQSPRTATQKYERVKKWAEKDHEEKTGQWQSFTMAEAWAYTLYRRAQDEIYGV